jgi:hypothetical protein
MHDYQPLHRYEHFNVLRYCMVSKLGNHFHADRHTLMPCISYLFWHIGLTGKVTRSHGHQVLPVGAHEVYGLLAKIAGK